MHWRLTRRAIAAHVAREAFLHKELAFALCVLQCIPTCIHLAPELPNVYSVGLACTGPHPKLAAKRVRIKHSKSPTALRHAKNVQTANHFSNTTSRVLHYVRVQRGSIMQAWIAGHAHTIIPRSCQRTSTHLQCLPHVSALQAMSSNPMVFVPHVSPGRTRQKTPRVQSVNGENILLLRDSRPVKGVQKIGLPPLRALRRVRLVLSDSWQTLHTTPVSRGIQEMSHFQSRCLATTTLVFFVSRDRNMDCSQKHW